MVNNHQPAYPGTFPIIAGTSTSPVWRSSHLYTYPNILISCSSLRSTLFDIDPMRQHSLCIGFLFPTRLWWASCYVNHYNATEVPKIGWILKIPAHLQFCHRLTVNSCKTRMTGWKEIKGEGNLDSISPTGVNLKLVRQIVQKSMHNSVTPCLSSVLGYCNILC